MAVERRYARYEPDPHDPDTLIYPGDDPERNTALAPITLGSAMPTNAMPAVGAGNPYAYSAPTRKTNEFDLDQFNRQLRTSDLWQSYMTSRGLPTDNRLKLSERQRGDFTNYLRSSGIDVPKGMKVDQSGNFNQKNTLWKNIGMGAAIGGAALGGLGLAGLGPLAGGGAAAAGGGAAAAGAGAGTAAGVGAGAATGAGMAAGSGLLSTALPHVITGVAGLGTSLLAQRSQNKAAERAAQTAAGSEGRMLDYYRGRDTEERADKSRADQLAQQRWEAEQQFLREQWAEDQKDRELKRQWALEDRDFEKADRANRDAQRGSAAAAAEQARREREARYAPYNALRAQALASLGSILGLGGPAQPGGGGNTLGQMLNLGGGAQPMTAPPNTPATTAGYPPATASPFGFTLADFLQQGVGGRA